MRPRRHRRRLRHALSSSLIFSSSGFPDLPPDETVVVVVVVAVVAWRVLWMKVVFRWADVALDVLPGVRPVERLQVGTALALLRRHQLQIDLRSGARAMRSLGFPPSNDSTAWKPSVEQTLGYLTTDGRGPGANDW